MPPTDKHYIYHHKLRSDNGTWKNSSYILISKGPKGQQNLQRNLTISKGVTVSNASQVTGSLRGDLILTNGGFLYFFTTINNFLLLYFFVVPLFYGVRVIFCVYVCSFWKT
jgi:hypothetical protein